METALHTQVRTAPSATVTPIHTGGVLQRACACGGSAGVMGDQGLATLWQDWWKQHGEEAKDD